MPSSSCSRDLCSSHFSFFFQCSRHHRSLHSFPTRRSSDLSGSRPANYPMLVRGGRHGHCRSTILRRGRRGSVARRDRKSTRLNSSHVAISYAVFCLKKKNSLRALMVTLEDCMLLYFHVFAL